MCKWVILTKDFVTGPVNSRAETAENHETAAAAAVLSFEATLTIKRYVQ